MTDLTEKLKELLMRCDIKKDMKNHILFNKRNGCYLGDIIASRLAQQLAPEIEKMMPRWVPAGERLPEDGQVVDLFLSGDNRLFNWRFFSKEGMPIKEVSHWRSTKGPMG